MASQYHDERLLYYGDTTIVGKLRVLLLEATEDHRLEMHEAPPPVWVIDQYRQPISETRLTVSLNEDEDNFMAYVALIRKILHQKGAKEGAYSQELWRLVKGGTCERYNNIVLTIGTYGSCLVIPGSSGFAFGPIRTFHRELSDISSRWIETYFQNTTPIPKTNWYNPNVAVNITGDVKLIIIVGRKPAIDPFTPSNDVIVVSTEGVPDEGTRAFLTRLVKRLPDTPVFACFDFDILGVRIYEDLRYGSREYPWQLAPIPKLFSVIYPLCIHELASKLQIARQFRALHRRHRECISELKQREWMSVDPSMSRSLDLMNQYGTFSVMSFIDIVPNLFQDILHAFKPVQ